MKATIVTDHLGNEYKSVSEMCRHYGIAPNTYWYRLSINWSVERALTEAPVCRTCYDHKGKSFKSLQAMCNYYGVTTYTYAYRRKQGWSLEDTLTKPIRCMNGTVHKTRDNCTMQSYKLANGNVKDHLGKEYKSTKIMCKS